MDTSHGGPATLTQQGFPHVKLRGDYFLHYTLFILFSKKVCILNPLPPIRKIRYLCGKHKRNPCKRPHALPKPQRRVRLVVLHELFKEVGVHFCFKNLNRSDKARL